MKYNILKPGRKQELAAIAGKIEGDFWLVAPKIAAPFVQDGTVIQEVQLEEAAIAASSRRGIKTSKVQIEAKAKE